MPFWPKAEALDPLTRLFAYLDDMYIVCSRDASLAVLCALEEALNAAGLKLNPTKTNSWCPLGVQGIPPTLPGGRCNTLKVLGGALKKPGHAEDEPVAAHGAGTALEETTQRLARFWDKLKGTGLSKQKTAALLRTYAGASSQHALRLEKASQQQADAYDAQLLTCWSDLLERPLTEDSLDRLGLPLKLGGLGLQLARTRRNAAPWSSWAATLEGVASDLGYEVLEDFLAALPHLKAELEELRTGLVTQGAGVPPEAALGAALKKAGKQKNLVVDIQRKTKKSLEASMDVDGKADFRTAAGPGAGAFMLYPVDPDCELENPLWATTARRRLGLDRPEAGAAELGSVATNCCNRTAQGSLCGAFLDAKGRHAAACACAGGRLRKHGRLARAVAGLARRWYDAAPSLEQRIPELDYRKPDGSIKHAIMDIVVPFLGRRELIDVTVRQGAAGSAEHRLAASRRDGVPSRRAEQKKHARYPTRELVAFAVEGCGRLGGEARAWLKRGAYSQLGDFQVAELTRAHRVVSAAVQGETARALRAAAGLR